MEKIGAWIRDPQNNIFKGQTKRSALYELFCENPASCDLLQKENTCLHCGAMQHCKFGSKRGTDGPTRRALSFYKTLQKWRDANEGFLGKLNSLKAYNRIFKTNGHYYLPYSFMTKNMGEGSPLESKWIPEDEMTTALLGKICAARPRAMLGGEILDYQKKEVPKFIADLHSHYPEIFALLPDEQKSRFKTISYVGRKADLTTCAPGSYKFGTSIWRWDGTVLHGKSMLFQPVKGELAITIKPKSGQPVEITDNVQVTTSTTFLD